MAEPRGPLRSAGFWLHHAALAWRHRLDTALRPLELTHTQFNLLASLHWLQRHHGAPTQRQVAAMSGADPMMASKVLTTLENRGLLTRHHDPSDGRAKQLATTPAGADLVSRAVRVVADVDTAFFATAHPDHDTWLAQLRTLTHSHDTPNPHT